MTDIPDVRRHDRVRLRELVLTACLMIAASTSEQHLSQSAIDKALGLGNGLRLSA